MEKILSKESIKNKLYADSPYDLGSTDDDKYRNYVDSFLEHDLFDKVLDIVFDGQYTNLYHQYHNTQR